MFERLTRKHVALIAVISLVALAGCGEINNDEGAKDIADDTGQNVTNVEPGGSYTYEIRLTEKNQIGLVKAQPPFTFDRSLERENLIRRYQYLNDANNQHHLYLMSNDGKVVRYFVIQGKVSSVNSKLTNNKQIVSSGQCLETTHNDAEGGCFKAVESPQMDGSYGTNGDAIFGFTTSGDYIEWNGKYLVSEEPQGITTEPVLVERTENPDGTDDSDDNSTDTNTISPTAAAGS
jgi:hypothetical protein